MTATALPQTSFWQAKKGIASWLFTLDHKRIGLLYLFSIGFFFLVAAGLGVLMRLELLNPGRDLMDPQTYNQVFTLHGVIMIFLLYLAISPFRFCLEQMMWPFPG